MPHSLGRLACVAGLLALLPGLAAAGTGQAPHRPPALAGAARAADPNPGVRNYLYGVKALSPNDVWAVGQDCITAGGTAGCGTPAAGQTLIEHWNGTAWSRVPSPDPGMGDKLNAVTATSDTNAWAVGYYCSSSCFGPQAQQQTLILHWNGTAWSQVPSPSTFSSELKSVTATSPTDAWAVGYYCEPGCLSAVKSGTLIEHWNGTVWSKVTSPSPGGKRSADVLSGTSATGTGDAWAVGNYCVSGCGTSSATDQNLLEHWNGTAWSRTASPTPEGRPSLSAVSADSPADAWAAGSDSGPETMILHWNGAAWTQVTSPNPSRSSILYAVAAQSPSDVWAVGSYFSSRAGESGFKTLILHWDGTAWQQEASPNPGPKRHPFGLSLRQVSADSATDAWAVGSYCSARCGTGSEKDHTLILHWNGTRWSVS